MGSFWRSMKRLGRGIMSVLIMGGASYVAQDEKLILFTPLVMALGKFLRDKWNLKYIPF